MDSSLALLSSNYAYWSLCNEAKTRASTNQRNPPSNDAIDDAISEDLKRPDGLAQLVKNHVGMQQRDLKLRQHCSSIRSCREIDCWKLVLDETMQRDYEVQCETARLDLDLISKKRLERVSKEFKIAFVRRRSREDIDAFLNDENASSKVNIHSGIERIQISARREEEKIQGLYSELDLLDALERMQPSGIYSAQVPFVPSFWSAFQTPLQPISIEEFRVKFKELGPAFAQFGMDELSDSEQCAEFATSFLGIANCVCAARDAAQARNFSKRGIPSHLRASMWDLMIQSDMFIDHITYAQDECRSIRAQIAKYSLLTDRIILNDVNDWCKNDDTFFVFEDMIKGILLLWGRDGWILKNAPNASGMSIADMDSKLAGTMKGKWGLPIQKYPPNGLYPFRGLSNYAMIVSFIQPEIEPAYITFRQLYVRYFHNLHTISCHPHSLPNLLTTFESLLKSLDPLLFLHLTQNAGTVPIKFAFRWILYGFVGVLDVEQVLLLWDRILGFETTELLSAVAAALFLFRRERLMHVRGEKDVEAVLSDFSMVKVIPLLQHYYFIHGRSLDKLAKEWRSFTSVASEEVDSESD
ncbi:hypothetical protein HDU80_001232 [Chytriomyces hyalinus]|nr:hypothetical protein HDU80_001232 [Chytriomyces hyalinus]